jgi:hypothetical protein
MIPVIGYDASYARSAFRAKVKFEGFSSAVTLFYSVLEVAAKSVQAESDNRWIIANKAKVIPPFDKDAPVELMVIVPAGNDQYEQFLSAIALFEEFVAASLGASVDTTLRTIEADGPKCEKCGAQADWLCRTQFSGDAHFCDQHAKEDPHFEAPYFLWFRHESADAIT